MHDLRNGYWNLNADLMFKANFAKNFGPDSMTRINVKWSKFNEISFTKNDFHSILFEFGFSHNITVILIFRYIIR